MITSHRNKDTGIIETTYEGHVTVRDLIGYVSELKNRDKYPGRLLILTDAMNSRLEFGPDEDKVLAGMVQQYAPMYEIIKDAIIIDDPRSTAYSLLFRRAAAAIPNYEIGIFSTREAAIKWLLM